MKLAPKLFPVTREILRPLRFHPDDRLFMSLNKDGDHFVATIGSAGAYPSTAALTGWLQRVPARKRNDGFIGEQWVLEATDCTAIVISELWPPDQVIWEDDAKLVYDYILATVVSQESSLNLVARYKDYAELKPRVLQHSTVCPHIFNGVKPPKDNETLTLALYQKVAATCAIRTEGYALFMEQGTGKTPTAISAICEEAKKLRASGESRLYRVLVVCPKNVRMNWQSELKRFETVKGAHTVLRKGAMHRTKQVIEAMVPFAKDQLYTAVICGYETMVNSRSTLDKIEWDLMILDESHSIKNPRTARARAALKLRDCARKRMVLTGTPITNTPLDLWAQLEFLGAGFSGFQKWQTFKDFYGVFDVNGEGFRRLISVQNLPFMQERLARCSFIIRKEEALPDLPDKVYDVYEVEMTQKQSDIYKSVATKLMAEIEDEMNRANDRQLLINNVLVKLLRLSQITSGYVSWDPIKDETTGEIIRPRVIEHFTPNPKLDALIDILKDPDKKPNEKTLVWACGVPEIRKISERLTAEGIDHVTYYGSTKDADRVKNEWRYNNDPNCRVFVGNPASGGTGLNLLGYPPGDPDNADTNTTHVIYYSQNWSSTARSQSEDRGHRRGTRVHVRITDLTVPNTIDEEIRLRVTDKRASAFEITDLRSLLGRVLSGGGND